MYKIIFSFSLTCLFFSCAENSKETSAVSTDSTKQNTSSVMANRGPQPYTPLDTISPHSITEDKFPSGISYKGDLESACTWYDKNGRNYLILSTKSFSVMDKEFGGEEHTKELMGKLMVIKPGKAPELLWNLY